MQWLADDAFVLPCPGGGSDPDVVEALGIDPDEMPRPRERARADEQLDEKQKGKESQGDPAREARARTRASSCSTPRRARRSRRCRSTAAARRWPLRTKTIRRWLARLYYEASEEAARRRRRCRTRSACSRVRRCSTGSSIASTCGSPTTTVVIYLDLADPEWRAVEIATGRLAGRHRPAGPLQARARDAAAPDPGRGRVARGAAPVPELRVRGRLPADGRVARDGAPAGWPVPGAGPARRAGLRQVAPRPRCCGC